MSEYKETVTTSQDEGTNNAGAQVQQQTRKVDTSSSVGGSSIATNVVWFIVGVTEVGLAFRFVLKLLGANPISSFVDFVYSVSGVLTAPFDSIFGVTKTVSGTVHSVFEPSILVAAAVYALIGWGIVKLLNIDRTL
jgi:hypothetical protein